MTDVYCQNRTLLKSVHTRYHLLVTHNQARPGSILLFRYANDVEARDTPISCQSISSVKPENILKKSWSALMAG
jgi:hypothetical protein